LNYLSDIVGFRHSVSQAAEVFTELVGPVFDAVEEMKLW
jgi:hypothetical protein